MGSSKKSISQPARGGTIATTETTPARHIRGSSQTCSVCIFRFSIVTALSIVSIGRNHTSPPPLQTAAKLLLWEPPRSWPNLVWKKGYALSL